MARALAVAVLPRPDGVREELLDDEALDGLAGALGHLRREDAELRAGRVRGKGRGEGGRVERRVDGGHPQARERVGLGAGEIRGEGLVDAGELRGRWGGGAERSQRKRQALVKQL